MLRLKEARKAAGLSQLEVANKIGVTQSGLSNWENGIRKVDMMTLQRLAEIYEVSTDYLLGKDSRPNARIIRIPVLGSVPAGIPIEAIQDIVDWEEIPAAMAAGDKEYFALLVKGDSMYPDYLEGDVVIVRKAPDCSSGDVCVVYVNGYDATLKQVKKNEIDQSITLVPRNPAYPPRTYTVEDMSGEYPVTIAGVVVELRRKVGKK